MEKQQTPIEALLRLFEIESNTQCVHCGKPSRQWAQLNHAVFLCLTCAAAFRQYSWVTQIKSVNLDQWTMDQVSRLQRGGNDSFAKFLRHYGLSLAQTRLICTCRATAYYRAMLDGKAQSGPPSLEEGCLVAKEDIPLGDMSPGEIFQSAKDKAVWLGSKTKEIGSKGIDKIKQKVESGELKEGAKKVASSVSNRAKQLWGFVRSKIGQTREQQKK